MVVLLLMVLVEEAAVALGDKKGGDSLIQTAGRT